jgi:hypothetical protein
MSNETRNALTIIVAVCALALQFWTAKKPVETKILIARCALEISGMVAIIVATYFLLTTDNFTLPSFCALYNFFVQVAVFTISASPVARRDIVSLVFAAVIFATVQMQAANKILFKMQSQLAKAQSQLTEVQSNEVHNQAQIVTILQKLVGMPTPSPSPTPK